MKHHGTAPLAVFLLGVLVAGAACPARITVDAPEASGVVDPRDEDAGPDDADGNATADVFARLQPNCAACHTIGDKPYFRDLEAFESLIVANSTYVVRGNPGASRLLTILDGGDAQPMPPPPDGPFSRLEAEGQTQITVAEVAAWIEGLDEDTPPTPVDVPLVRRKSAEQVTRTLMDQLGLTESDFYVVSGDGTRLELAHTDSYPSRSPDAVPFSDPFNTGGTVFGALGGPFHLEGRGRVSDVGPPFIQALTHISQAWCRLAVEKSPSAVLVHATLADSLDTPEGAAHIRDNIRALWLRMLGAVATEDDVSELVAVYETYAPRGAQTSWTAVCAAIVRDPLWIMW